MYLCMSTFSNIFSSKATWPIEAKFHVDPPCDRVTIICSNGSGHMTRMAAMSIYNKNLKNLLLRCFVRSMTLKVGMPHRVLEYYQSFSNDDPGLTLTYFTIRSKFFLYAFVWEKGKTMNFSKTSVVYNIKVGRCSQINEYMDLYKYERSRSFIDLGPWSLRFNLFKLLFL